MKSRAKGLFVLCLAITACASSSTADGDGVAQPPEVGDVVETSIRLDLQCQNTGIAEAFDLVWNSLELAPVEWNGRETLEGTLQFESLERSTFTAADGGSVVVSNSLLVTEECAFWEE